MITLFPFLSLNDSAVGQKIYTYLQIYKNFSRFFNYSPVKNNHILSHLTKEVLLQNSSYCRNFCHKHGRRISNKDLLKEREIYLLSHFAKSWFERILGLM